MPPADVDHLLEFWHDPPLSILRCSGKLGPGAASEFVRLVTSLPGSVPAHLLVNWSAVSELEACAFAGFADLVRLYLSAGGEVAMAAVPPPVRAQMAAARLEPCFEWFDSEAAARAYLARRR